MEQLKQIFMKRLFITLALLVSTISFSNTEPTPTKTINFGYAQNMVKVVSNDVNTITYSVSNKQAFKFITSAKLKRYNKNVSIKVIVTFKNKSKLIQL